MARRSRRSRPPEHSGWSAGSPPGRARAVTPGVIPRWSATVRPSFDWGSVCAWRCRASSF